MMKNFEFLGENFIFSNEVIIIITARDKEIVHGQSHIYYTNNNIPRNVTIYFIVMVGHIDFSS